MSRFTNLTARSLAWATIGLLAFAACRDFEAGSQPASGGDGGAPAGGGTSGGDDGFGGNGPQPSAGQAGSGTQATGGSTVDPQGGAAGSSVDMQGGAAGTPDNGGAGGQGDVGPPRPLGAPSPGTPVDPDENELFELGYYRTSNNRGELCLDTAHLPYSVHFGDVGSRPYVLRSPLECGFHQQATEFAAVGIVINGSWYSSPNDLYWQFGLDDKYDGQQGVSPWPAVWQGVLVAFEMLPAVQGEATAGRFTVDWEQTWWQSSPETAVQITFAPTGLLANEPAYPVVGRWRREYGQRLGLYQSGHFYLDWDGDNAWDDELDRVATFSAPGTYPVAADFTPGQGDEIALYADGKWFIDANGNQEWDGEDGGDLVLTFGEPSTLPMVARNGWACDCDL